MRTPQALQLALFERIQHMGASAQDLAKALNLGLGAVYKRMKGETLLDIAELALLAERYNLSLDSLFQPEKGKVTFEFPPLTKSVNQLEQYLSEIRDTLEWGTRQPGAHMYYSTAEITFFHYLHFPELTAFKLYMWNRTTWELPEWDDRPFQLEPFLDNRRLQRLREEILMLYNQLPSTEFWPVSILNNTLNSIHYCAESGAFAHPDYMPLLKGQLEKLIQHQKEMAKTGLKFNPADRPDGNAGTFTLYHNEIAHTNITIMLESQKGKMVFTTFDNPNFMRTTDPEFARYAVNWFAKLRKRSLLISIDGEKHRNRFFNLLHGQIEGETARR